MSEALKELERALCEFTNGASDQYNPAEWVAETKRNFEVLCNAYEAAYAAGVFSSALTAGEQEPVAWPCSLGVGDGDGKLFVHGDYDSIKAAQAIIFQAGEATAQLEALRKEREGALDALVIANARADRAEARVAELEKAQKRDFNAGYVIACCNIMNLHRDEVVAFDVLEQLGVSSAEVRAMNLGEYDAAALKKIEGARSESPYAARRVREGEKVDG